MTQREVRRAVHLTLISVQAPELSTDWFLRVVNATESWPGWLQAVFEYGTDAGLVVFAALFLFAWWRARSRSAFNMTLALVAPAGAVGAYLVSNTLKDIFEQQRPCQVMPEVSIIATCQEAGSWSFPSNHATVVAAAAAAVMVAWPRLGFIGIPVALTMAASRVIVGVHYPHDVIIGVLLGGIVAALLTLLLGWIFYRLINAMRNVAFFAFFLGTGPKEESEDLPEPTEPPASGTSSDTMMLTKVRDDPPPPRSAPPPGPPPGPPPAPPHHTADHTPYKPPQTYSGHATPRPPGNPVAGQRPPADRPSAGRQPPPYNPRPVDERRWDQL